MTATSQQKPSDYQLADPARLAQNLSRAFEQAASIAREISARPDLAKQQTEAQVTPLEQVQKTLGAVAQSYLNNPAKLMEEQQKLWSTYGMIWQNAWSRALGAGAEPIATPQRNDRRFKDKDWQENSIFDFLKQVYIASSDWAQKMVADAEGIDEHTRLKAKFYVEQIVNALSPSNFPASNPEVLRATLASNGENLLEGLRKLEGDMKAADGRLRIRQTDTSAFEVGKNIATTPGKVVFRNATFELIQYSPAVKRTYEIPLLIVPPWINKFYILDLNPKKSFVRWATEQGLTVFVMSWVNADEKQGRKSFSDYMHEGFLTAVQAVLDATGAEKVNSIGYCVGGTLVAASLAYMAAKGDNRVNAATFFTTQVDFEEAGDLLVYVDEEQVKWIEGRMEEKGYLPGSRMADAFNLLRSNDLIWSNLVNSYLLGKDPLPFDLLFWNSDSTQMPAGVHSFYLRECYLANKLSQGKMVLDNVRIDLSKVKIPVYNLAAREDHIAPLPSVFRLGKFMGGDTRLVVAGSGHIAGVINPPEARKYHYWTNEAPSSTLEAWLKSAKQHEGSWWPDWAEWVTSHSGDKIAAPVPGEGKLPVIEDAPGSYVRVLSE